MVTLTSTITTVAPTQNTAPVHEFRCLYTRDLHKKSKKWHDGSARFHTFNQRVMVYDDARNFIGDLHYRQEEEFGEGLEIRLDRGVLVEVGERLGETQTDLAPILDRQRPEKASSPPRPRPAPGLLSQRPKSLLEVLGPSQGRLGRGRIPLHSPYSQRYASSRVEPTEPPSKRPRLSSDKENHTDGAHRPVGTARPSLPQPLPPSKPVSRSTSRNAQPIEYEEVFVLSSDEEARPGPRKAARLATSRGQKPKEAPEKSQAKSGSPKSPAVPVRKPQANILQPKRQPPLPTKSIKATAPEPVIISRPCLVRKARLLLAQPKTRSKLTCILPFSGAPRPAPETRLSLHDDDDLLLSQDVVPESMGDDPALSMQIPSSPFSRLEPDEVVPAKSSPLFMPEENVASRRPSPTPLPTQEEFLMSDTEDHDAFESLEHLADFQNQDACREAHSAPAKSPESRNESLKLVEPEKELELELEAGLDNLMQSRPDGQPYLSEPDNQPESRITVEEEEEPAAPESVPEAEKPDRQKQQTEPTLEILTEARIPADNTSVAQKSQFGDASKASEQPPVAIPRLTTSQGRPFRRVRSENDTMVEDLAPDPLPVVAVSRTPLAMLENVSTRRAPAAFKSPSKIQRCASDTLAIDKSNQRVSKPGAEPSQEPTGPWTIDEAFLLFEWWPPAVEKPEYWTNTASEPVSRALPEPGPSNWGGITSARQFLRDELNVL